MKSALTRAGKTARTEDDDMKIGTRVVAALFAVVFAGSILGCAARASVRPPPERATVVVR
jgi:hypothetical protein